MTLYFEPSPDRVRGVLTALEGRGRSVDSLVEMSDIIRTDRTEQLAVLGPGVPLAEALAFAGNHRLSHPALGVVLLRDNVDVRVLGEAIRAGVREVVDAADTPGISSAVLRSLGVSRQLSGQAANGGTPIHDGKLVTVFAGKGGCGKSTIATNLAVALAAGGARRVLLVDLDLSFGDVAIMLQLVPERSLIDGIPMAGRLDETGLRSLLTPYAPGLETLLAPVGPADGERINRNLVTEALQVAQRAFDFVVIDTPPFFSDAVLAALDMSDWYVLLATPDIQALKNLRLTLDMFDLLEYRKDKRLVVLNRSDARVGLTPADIERVVRAPIVGYVPSTRDVPVSINKGVPLLVETPTHPVSLAIVDLVNTKLASPVPAAAVSAGSGRRRPFSRKVK